jgi:hypothetical protein
MPCRVGAHGAASRSAGPIALRGETVLLSRYRREHGRRRCFHNLRVEFVERSVCFGRLCWRCTDYLRPHRAVVATIGGRAAKVQESLFRSTSLARNAQELEMGSG